MRFGFESKLELMLLESHGNSNTKNPVLIAKLIRLDSHGDVFNSDFCFVLLVSLYSKRRYKVAVFMVFLQMMCAVITKYSRLTDQMGSVPQPPTGRVGRGLTPAPQLVPNAQTRGWRAWFPAHGMPIRHLRGVGGFLELPQSCL
jgi:hypothetical protein